MRSDYETQRNELHLYDGLEEYPCTGENFLIQGPVGVIEAVMSKPEDYKDGAPIVVVCHPHPLHGGSMGNKVVHIVSETFNDMGLCTLRFNFRGVGHSVGKFDAGNGETDDLGAVVEWVRERFPGSVLWLAGFSFGAYVAYRGQKQVAAERLLLVAPPVTMFEFNHQLEVTVPWMVIQGGKDEIISPQQVSIWVKQQSNQPNYQWLGDADHFFHGRLNHIRNAIKDQWAVSFR